MKKKISKLSFYLSFLMILQLLLPIINVFAAEEIKAPTNLKLNIYNVNDVHLTWDAVPGISKYRVYKINNDQKELLAETSKNTWYKAKIEEGSYTFAVSAVSGATESVLSSSVNAQIVYPEVKPPTGLAYTIYNGNDVNLYWQKAENATSYNVYRVANGKRELVATTTSTRTSYYISQLPEGEYVYEVVSVSDRFGESEISSKITISVVHPELQPPAGLAFIIYNGNDVNLSWQKAEYANGYKVYKVVDGKRELITTTTATKTGYYFSQLPEGDYEFLVTTISDRFGESETGSQITISLVHPEIQPPSGLAYSIYNGNDVLLYWQKANYATSYNVYRVVDGKREFITKTTSTKTSYYFSQLPEDEYVYEISTVSDRFGESETFSKIIVPLGHPEINPPSDLAYTIYNGNDLNLYWKKADYAKEYKVYRVVDGIRELVTTTTNTSHYFSQLPEDNYVYEVTTVSDRFGESLEASRVEASIIYPLINAPTIQLQMQGRDAALISWDKVDSANFYNIYEIVDGEAVWLGKVTGNSYYAAGLIDGIHEFIVTAVNTRFGESPESNKVSAEVKPETPALYAPTPSEPIVEGDNVTLSWNTVEDADSYNIYQLVDGEKVLVGNTKNTSLTIEDLEAGDHEFYIVPVAESGVEGEDFATVTVQAENFDITPPVTTANVTDEWLKDDFTVKLTATDDKSGVDKTFYSIDGAGSVEGTEFTITDEGVHKVYFYSIDKAGNIEAVKTVEVKIDKTAPVTTSNVEDKWFSQDFTVELTATDDISGVAKTYYSVNGSEFTEGTSFELNEAGIHEVSFYSVDNAGNVEEVKTVEVKIDDSAPVTTSNVDDVWSNKAFTVELTAADDLSGVEKTFYSLNDGEFVQGTSFEVSKPGVYKVKFFSLDNAGNVEEIRTVEVKIDEQAPETTSNVEEKWSNQAYTVELTATDDLSGVAKTYYSVNGSEFVEGTSLELSESGNHKVSFYSTDNAGNTEEVKTVQVKIDTTAPETVSNVQEGWLNQAYTVELTAIDDLSGVAKTYYSVNGSEFVEGTSFELTEEGVHQVSFYSVDNAGNIETAKTAEVKIDKTAPQVSWNLEKEYALGTNLNTAFKATDNLSGIAVEEVTVNGEVVAKGESILLGKPGTYNILVTVTDNAGLKTTLEKTISVYIQGNLEITPGTIKINKGVFTARVTLPEGFEPNFDLSSATLNGVAAVNKGNGSEQQASKGMFKFNREDFDWNKGEVLVEFRGTVNGQLVVAKTTVTVK